MKPRLFYYPVLFFSALIVISSCTSNPNEKGEFVIKPNSRSKEIHVKYLDNGSIDYIQQYADTNPAGLFIKYKQGIVKNISFINNNLSNGCGIVFHQNGSLNNFGQYLNGNKNGWFYVFDKQGNLSGKREYLLVNGNEYLNQWIDYKPDGSIEKTTSNYIKVIPIKDTIGPDDEYNLNICLEAAFFKQYMIMIVGPFDSEFNLAEGSNCDTLKSVNFCATYKTKEHNKGINTIRGMVQDLQPDANDPKKINIRKIYFSHDFRVR